MTDHHVDRPEVYAQQCVQPTGTNRPRAWIDNEVRARYGVPQGAAPSVGCAPLTTGFGGHGGGVTPVPIPNTEVKPSSADGTWVERPWESRTPPSSPYAKDPQRSGVLRRFRPLPPIGSPPMPKPPPSSSSGRGRPPRPSGGKGGAKGGGRQAGPAGPPERGTPWKRRADDAAKLKEAGWGGVARKGAGRVRDAGPGRRVEGVPRGAPEGREAWEPEVWIDEGVVRGEADRAVGRGRRGRRPAASADDDDLAPDPSLRKAVAAKAADRLEAKVKDAGKAFRRERFEEARAILRPLAEQAPTAESVRELLGLTYYRLGRWKLAVTELEAFRASTAPPSSTRSSPTATGRWAGTRRSPSCGRSCGPPRRAPRSWPRAASSTPARWPTRAGSPRPSRC